MMKIEIKQGRPKHKFFTIAVPKMQFEESLVPGETEVTLTHPKTGCATRCVYFGHWDIKNQQEFIVANRFCLLSYGGGASFMLPLLKEQYPELKDENCEIEYWLLKEVEPNN